MPGHEQGHGQRQGYGLRPLAGAVAAITQPIAGRRGFSDAAILARWPEIAGPELAAATWPDRIARPRGRGRNRSQDGDENGSLGGDPGGVLHLRVGSGALATEIQHAEPVIIQRINAVFGYRAVARLRLLHAPAARPAAPAPTPPPRPLSQREEARLARHLAAVTDPELRRQLLALGRAVFGSADANDEPGGSADADE